MIKFKSSKIEHSVYNTAMQVRVNDLNYGNHLGHDALISFFHEARVRFLRSLGYIELDVDGFGMLVTNLSVNYVSEAFYADNIKIDIGLGSLTRTSIQLIYRATHNETNSEIATAQITSTFYDFQKSKVVKVPQKFLLDIANLSKIRE